MRPSIFRWYSIIYCHIKPIAKTHGHHYTFLYVLYAKPAPNTSKMYYSFCWSIALYTVPIEFTISLAVILAHWPLSENIEAMFRKVLGCLEYFFEEL